MILGMNEVEDDWLWDWLRTHRPTSVGIDMIPGLVQVHKPLLAFHTLELFHHTASQ